jgi:hypothetical protein
MQFIGLGNFLGDCGSIRHGEWGMRRQKNDACHKRFISSSRKRVNGKKICFRERWLTSPPPEKVGFFRVAIFKYLHIKEVSLNEH